MYNLIEIWPKVKEADPQCQILTIAKSTLRNNIKITKKILAFWRHTLKSTFIFSDLKCYPNTFRYNLVGKNFTKSFISPP